MTFIWTFFDLLIRFCSVIILAWKVVIQVVTISMGIAVLSIVTGLGIMFLLWTLYHLTREGNSKFFEKIHAQVNRSIGSFSLEACRLSILFVLRRALSLLFTSQKARASSHQRYEAEALRQRVFSLRRRIDVIQEELEQRRSTGKPSPLTRTASRN
jgi:ABC-type multidrug transport system fused ATPase/permease subunit